MAHFASLRLTGERVVLRGLHDGDVDALFAMMAHPQAMRYWATPPMQSRDEAQQIVADARAGAADGSYLELAIARRDDDTLLGKCTLFHFHHASRRAEIGYILAPEHWGHGYMHEALTLLVDWAFGPFGLHRLEADIDPRNDGSRRTLKRLGFTHEGTLRDRWRVNGEISDTGFYGLLAREWEARRPRTGVWIRETRAEDLPTLFAFQADPDAAAMAAFPSRDRAAFDAHWARIFSTPDVYAYTILAGDEIAGSMGVFGLGGREFVGYWIGRALWGRGIASEGLRLTLLGRTDRPLYAYVAQHNIGSIRVLEKNGFVRVEDDGHGEPPVDGTPEYLYRLG